MNRFRDIKRIRRSRFFDAEWYKHRYPELVAKSDPARHYLIEGSDAGLDPGPEFSTRGYLARNPDVATAKLNPLLHFELYGQSEGRQGFATPNNAPDNAGPESDAQAKSRAAYAVIVHAYYPDGFAALARALEAFPDNVDRYISYPRNADDLSEEAIRAAFPGAIPIDVDNSGQDIGAFLQVLERIDRHKYAFYCKLHTKAGNKLPGVWREALLTGTVGNAARVAQFERLMRENPDVMLGGGQDLFLHGPSYVLENSDHLKRLLNRAELPADLMDRDWGFFAGSFFWIQSALVERLLLCLRSADFTTDVVTRDGQLAHAGERLIGMLALSMGGQVGLASCVEQETAVMRFAGLPAETLRHCIPMTEILQALQRRRIGQKAQAMVAGREPGLGFTRARRRDTQTGTLPEDYAIITPTGDRPAAFNRCIQMVVTQSVRPKEWIVVDDGITPLTTQLRLPDWATYVRRPPVHNDPPHTLSCNVLAALDHVSANRVLIFEDDDWYSPLYAEFMLPWLDTYDMVGLNFIRYYHLLGSAWKTGHPPSHTAFAQTGFCRGHAWDHLAAVCRTGFVDIREKGVLDRHWWQTFEGRKFLINDHPSLHLGLKGGFGRSGLASGHERREVDYIPDPDGKYLQEIIGQDALYYERWRRPIKNPFVIYTTALGQQAARDLPVVEIPLFDCYAFTDVPGALPKPWQAIPIESVNGDVAAEIAKIRQLPHLYFPDYEWSIWGDPDIVIQEDLHRLIGRIIETACASESGGLVGDRYRFVSLGGRAIGAALKGGGLVVRRHPAPTAGGDMLDLWRALSA